MRARTSRLRSLFCGTVTASVSVAAPAPRNRSRPDGSPAYHGYWPGSVPPFGLTAPRWGRAVGLGVEPRHLHHDQGHGTRSTAPRAAPARALRRPPGGGARERGELHGDRAARRVDGGAEAGEQLRLHVRRRLAEPAERRAQVQALAAGVRA